MLAAVPQPIPGKQAPTPPRPSAEAAWVNQPLVETSVSFNRADGRHETVVEQAYGVRVLDNHSVDVGVDERAFRKLGAASLVDAVESASKLASEHGAILPAGRVNPLEKSIDSAVAVLQAADGAYYAATLGTGLRSREVNDSGSWHKEYSIDGFATVNTGMESLTVNDVKALHPDVKAVVGPYSWVNFTDEQIEPQLAH